ncbi:protein involved in gliding motility SprE [Lutibacter sp. Hel_I_33_5]|uniref:type IX secretion system periplasmic lipoprotein PorW/SprE n=1 Tax=Lutibacter sp. Hel_I_33_5 TaxID=1566289 RepID=UPI0011A32926|nr:tetratricopeptide repeat protein [Lutibacter sp. Hel_I_33_5]TVZ56345.1 protein involved in gliding motility SprE [Lutibacter sp. Hel_I_33_5]
MKNIKNSVLVLVFCGLAVACSTKKDTAITRNWHALTTKYNVLFNGKEEFKKGIKEINEKYEDDFFTRLPIEPIEFKEEDVKITTTFDGPGGGFDGEEEEEKTLNSPFDKAEDKATKAIQKHSINIYGRERNRQIDDAYLLLGKSRYYTQRFIPAVEAFNYVIANYPSADLIAETKIWRAKANIRLDNEEMAIEAMNLLLVVRDTLEADLPDIIKEQAHTALAMAYAKTDTIQKVIHHLTKATETYENREQSARNLFILGQIYSNQNKKDSAFAVFQKLSNFKKAPHKYRINSNIELAKNFSNDSTANGLINRLVELTEDIDNRKYLSGLFYQLGNLEENRDSVNTAREYYKKSIRTKYATTKQKTYSFESLGNINFKESNYQLASSYYDSVLVTTKDTLQLRIRRVKRKHKNLASLIKYENTLVTNDSILKIAALSEDEQKIFFEKYVERIKKEDEEKAQQQLNAIAFGGSFGSGSLQSAGKAGWYFYNNQSLEFGKTEFVKIWGTRKQEDNWRWSSKPTEVGSEIEKDSVSSLKNSRYDVASYLAKIPKKQEVIDSLFTQRNQALYELGVIYKEQFRNPDLAINRLERVSKINKDESLILPINYHLYQLYTDLGSKTKAEKHEYVILNDFPDTKFAQLIKNPGEALKEEESVDETQNLYKEVYYLYKDKKYPETIKKVDETLPNIQNSVLIPKFELLKAYAIGKYYGKAAYQQALEFVSVNYASTEEGDKAKEILTRLIN